jgi:uncharacterized protein YegL
MSSDLLRRISRFARSGLRPQLGLLAVLLTASAVFARSEQIRPGIEPPPQVVDPAPILPADAPRIEAVFVLDTTGSMSGLIEGAKQKIWSIANQLASAQSGPRVRLGLIGYRDRGDHYVTRRFDLSEDVDTLYAHLSQFSAGGGGDGPESVNQALNEAVTRIGWSTDQGVYRVIFLVGDAPPHMDYSNDVPYPKSVELARAKGIVVNAIQCGSNANTARVWQSIAQSGGGAFSAIAQDGGMVAMTTPMDDELGRLNTALAATALGYGTAGDKDDLLGKMQRALSAAPSAVASRLSYLSKRGGKLNSGRADLVDAVVSGEVALEEVPNESLPEEMQPMSRDEQHRYLRQKTAERESLRQQIAALAEQRDAYVAKETAKLEAEGKGDGFDAEVMESIRRQAVDYGILY